jgi:predicted dehydrogenase
MSDQTNIQQEQPASQEQPISNGRRTALKTLISIPALGGMAYGVYKKVQYDNVKRSVGEMFRLDPILPPSSITMKPDGETIRLGIIGFGIRGKQLLRAAGFPEPSWIDDRKKDKANNPRDTRYDDYMNQDNLNVVVNGVCDIFDTYGEAAILAGSNIYREGSDGKYGTPPKRYRHYREMLEATDIDAVIIASPDHWHGVMAMDAAKAGKHVYLEKPVSWTVPETYMVRDVINESGVTFQLGHQGRQTDSYLKARQIIEQGILGPVTLIQMTTNRNTPNGAWVYDIHETASPQTIDWKQFEGDPDRIREYMDYMKSNGLERYIGPEEREKFDLPRFFRWRCWWDYSTGLSGDLLTHEYDAVNQILDVGIPHSATSSGGVYFFKDGRTVPDVLQTTFEFPEKNMTLLYSATQASEHRRGKIFMGHDAMMDLSSTITVTVDPRSTRYAEQIASGLIKPDMPIITYIPGQTEVDAITSATELYFAQRGLLYAYVGGRRFDTTHLHIREWLECIRNKTTPSCDMNAAFEEGITAHMGTRAYLEGRTMYWDKDKEEIVRG